MANVVVVGAQWGDEGKGKIVDWLSERADIVARFQGGHNAGHTIVIDGAVYKLSLLPSGIVRGGKLSVIGNGVVLDPWHLVREVAALREKGVSISPDNLIIAENAPLILSIHGELDRARENQASVARIGTTGRGIGPAYEDKVGRRAIRVADLGDEEDGGLEALAKHGEERHRDQCRDGPLGERAARFVLERGLDGGGVLPHPDDHVGDHADRDEGHDRLEALLLPVRECAFSEVQANADGRAQDRGGANAERDPAQRVPAPVVAQERGDDAHDESGLEALTKPDDECRKHERPHQRTADLARIRVEVRSEDEATYRLSSGSRGCAGLSSLEPAETMRSREFAPTGR